MAITIFLEFTAKAGTGGDMLAALKEILPDTRSYDGCISNNVFQSRENPDTLLFTERGRARTITKNISPDGRRPACLKNLPPGSRANPASAISI